MKKTFIVIFLIFSSLLAYPQSEDKGDFQYLAGYYNDIYNDPISRNYHFYHSGFGYKGDLTSIYGKVNLGSKYETISGVRSESLHNVQLELDYWQSFSKSKSTLMWLNYAYGLDDFYPEHRIIFRAWQKLFSGFLVSGGINHYRFSEFNANFLNAGLEKYFGRWWIEGETTFYLKDPHITTTYGLSGRMFIKDINFLEVGISAGSAQDEPFILQNDADGQFAYTGKARYVSNIFSGRMRISGSFTYIHEEYRSDRWRNRYSMGVGLIINLNK